MDPASEPPASVAFGPFRVLPHRRELLADGQPIKLGGRAFDVLMALIEARGAVVGKDALMRRVWPNRIVEENSLQAQISALRAAFGAERELIRTVAGHGYQFTGEIRILAASRDERIGAADVCVTSDVPLASRCLANGARAVGPDGRVWTEANIGGALAGRELSRHLRELGLPTRGPAALTKADRSRFLSALDTEVQKALRIMTNYPSSPSVRPEIEPESQTALPRRRLSFR